MEIHVTVEQKRPYRRLVKNIVIMHVTQAKKVYLLYGKHCTEGKMMQQPNPVQAMCNMVDGVQHGSGLLSVRRRVYSTAN